MLRFLDYEELRAFQHWKPRDKIRRRHVYHNAASEHAGTGLEGVKRTQAQDAEDGGGHLLAREQVRQPRPPSWRSRAPARGEQDLLHGQLG